jgi:inhibitor of KinA
MAASPAVGVEVVPFGDRTVLVTFGDVVDERLNGRALAYASAVRELAREEPGFGEPVPAHASVVVPVDPFEPGVATAIERLRTLADNLPAATETSGEGSDAVEIPTRYGGPDGPDLETVAREVGRSPADVVELHASTTYRVFFVGFAPGFAYLGTLPEALSVGRLGEPRQRVPAGSVAIAGRQTAVYPFATPGGWRLIGHTDLRVWDLGRDPPALLLPGRPVRFVAIDGP